MSSRQELISARLSLQLTQKEAGNLVDPPLDGMKISRYENGAQKPGRLRDLCRGYMREARRLGYNAWDYHESVLCPNDKFPPPVRQDDEELDRILGPLSGSDGEGEAAQRDRVYTPQADSGREIK